MAKDRKEDKEAFVKLEMVKQESVDISLCPVWEGGAHGQGLLGGGVHPLLCKGAPHGQVRGHGVQRGGNQF